MIWTLQHTYGSVDDSDCPNQNLFKTNWAAKDLSEAIENWIYDGVDKSWIDFKWHPSPRHHS